MVAEIPVAVNVTGDPARVPLVAVKVFGPVDVPKVQLPIVATPPASVVVINPVAEPLPEVTAKVTLTPLTGLPFASFTITLGSVATEVPTVADCPLPEFTKI